VCVCVDELPSCLQCIIDFTCMSFHVSVTVRNKISRISHTVLSCTFLYFMDWLMCQLSTSFTLENRSHTFIQNSADVWLLILQCYATDSVIEQNEWKAASLKDHLHFTDYQAYCTCKFIRHLKWVTELTCFNLELIRQTAYPSHMDSYIATLPSLPFRWWGGGGLSVCVVGQNTVVRW
jgi:hypothetical protein